MRGFRALAAAGLAAALLAGCGSGYDNSGSSGGTLKIMIASSGDAETKAVQDAAAAWQKKTGHKVEVIAAQNLSQQLTQGFAGGNPPDVFYTDPTVLQQYASGGSLYAYGDQLPKSTVDDFYPALRQAYTYKGKLYCAPKDLNTHALIINTDMWRAAGLTAADYPKTWGDLTRVATKLTTKQHVGLTVGGDHNTVGTFMLEAGGWFVNAGSTKVTADSAANLTALKYLQGNMKKGIFATPKSLDTQDPGEALGTGKAAMDVDGGWIEGQMNTDYPKVHWKAIALPAGPGGKGTTVYSNCWGIAAHSANKKLAVSLVESLVAAGQQKKFMDAFGVIPSRQSLAGWATSHDPKLSAVVAGMPYAQGPVAIPGFASVLADFDTKLETLFTTGGDPKQVLESLQANGDDALKQN